MTLTAASIRSYAAGLRSDAESRARLLAPGLTAEGHAVYRIHGVSDDVLTELADGAEVGRIPCGDGWEQPVVTVSCWGGLTVLACGAAVQVAAVTHG